MHALYFPVAVVSTLAFVLISLICAPISFVLFVLKSLRRTFSKQIKMPWYHIVIFIFVSIIFGIPFQIIKTIKDTINFSISLYETNLKRKYIAEVDEGIFEKLDLDFVQCFLNFLEREYSDCDEYVSSSKIIKEIRDQFEVVDQISRLLYCNSILFNKIEVQKELNEIKAGLKQIKRVSTVFANHRKNESIHSNSMSQIIESPFKRKFERPSISTNEQKEDNDS